MIKPSKIETFEYNIIDELKNKNATVVDIAGMDGTIETKKDEPVKLTINANKIILILLFIAIIIAIVVLLVLKFTKPKQVPPITQENLSSFTSSTELKTILPSMDYYVGRFVSSVSVIDNGYSLGLSDFSSVYSYTSKNGSSLGRELQEVFKITRTASSTETFKDVILSNQDMRVLSDNGNDVVYAFVEDKWLVLATSTEGILTIKSVILSK